MRKKVKCRDCARTVQMETLWETLNQHEELLEKWIEGEDIFYKHSNGWVEHIIHTDLPIICHNFFCPKCVAKEGDRDT